MVFSRLRGTTSKSPGAVASAIDTDFTDSTPSVINDGSLAFTREIGGNDSKPSYQEAAGAPVEVTSPLGYEVNWITIIFLNVGMMVGTGVFSTPASILAGTGSVGLSLIYWVIGFPMTAAALAVYLELAAYFPNRSGSETVYLEQAYPRPKHFFPVAYAVQSVLLSFSSSNAIVLASYTFRLADHDATDWERKGVALAAYTLAAVVVIANTKFSMWMVNIIGAIKVLTLVFISITGLVVLGGHTRVEDPGANFRDAFAGTNSNGNSLSTALVKIIFAYQGYANSFNLVNEVKNPIPTLKRNSSAALLIVTVLYILCNVAFFAAVPKETLVTSEQVAASLFFQNVFGSGNAARGLNFLVMLSAFGNLVAVLVGQSRMIRECGRQGVLPFTKFWVSTRPFGTPLGPYLLKWGMTTLMILAPPAGDAFNFVVDLASYPEAIFLFLMTVGVFIIRYRWKKVGRPAAEFKAWDVALVFFLLVNLFVLVMPWYPPEGGATGGDVSFWYATYCVTGIGIILACGAYYVVWIYILPRFGGYRIRQEVKDFGGGATSHNLVKVPNDQLGEWDATHDEVGHVRGLVESDGDRKIAAHE